MAAVDDDDRPKKKIAHEIGQDLTLLSAAELADRIGLLKDEIARLEADMARKRAIEIRSRQYFQKISVFKRLSQGPIPGLVLSVRKTWQVSVIP